MTDWSTARTHAGDPADVFVALAELLELTHRPPWHRDAACREHPRELFFPKPGQPAEPAKAICARCLVRDECQAYALGHDEPLHGIWAGMSGRGRQKLRRRPAPVLPVPDGWCISCRRLDALTPVWHRRSRHWCSWCYKNGREPDLEKLRQQLERAAA